MIPDLNPTVLLPVRALARLALAFGRTERATRHEDGVRPETDSDHTVMLGWIAATLCPPELDVGRVAQFALAHDAAEAKVGDTNTLALSAEGHKKKAEREAWARQELEREHGPTSWLCQTLAAYEAQACPESRFVRILDKVLPKLTHLENGCVAAKATLDRAGFVQAHRDQWWGLRTVYPEPLFDPLFDLLGRAMFECEAAWGNDAPTLFGGTTPALEESR